MECVLRVASAMALAMVPFAASSTGWAAGQDIAAAPQHTSGPNPIYPRLVQFPDAKVMAGVNALLAAQEKADRSSRDDCLEQLKEAHQKPDADSYSAEITVTYLSRHYLSVNVVTGYDCGGAYPTAGAETPMTFDLDRGAAVDWTAEFKPGFLTGADENSPPSALTKLYRARYSRARDDADCRGAITEQDPFSSSPSVWLDRKRGLVVEPDFPHAIAACANELALSPADLASALKDTKLLADLKNAANSAPGHK